PTLAHDSHSGHGTPGRIATAPKQAKAIPPDVSRSAVVKRKLWPGCSTDFHGRPGGGPGPPSPVRCIVVRGSHSNVRNACQPTAAAECAIAQWLNGRRDKEPL